MRFIVDADLPYAVKPILERFGHEAVDVRQIGMGRARDPVIAAFAQEQRAIILSADFDFADIRVYPPHEYAGIVVLTFGRRITPARILLMVEELLADSATLARVPGRLAIVQHGHTRFHPDTSDDENS